MMDDLELQNIASSLLRDAVGFDSGDDLRRDIEENIKAYRGDLYGTEREGYSNVVDRSVMDVVEWTVPKMMKTFHGSDQAVEFTMEGPDPEGHGEDATDYVNDVYLKGNDGYNVSQEFIKDGLITKLGVVKIWVEPEEEVERRQFQTDDFNRVALLAEQIDASEDLELELEPIDADQGILSGAVTRRVTRQKIRVEAVPNEEFLLERRAKKKRDVSFVCHRYRAYRSDLIEMGYDAGIVMDIPADQTSYLEDEHQLRYDRYDGLDRPMRLDPAMQEVVVSECYMRVDYDEDGVAEWRKVTLVGHEDHTLLDNEEIDGHPFVWWSPVVLPHETVGWGYADLVGDLQKQKTEFVRQMSDGLILVNHPRYGYNSNGLANLDDALDSAPGDMIAMRSPDDMWRLDQGWEGIQAMPMLEYLDAQREARTGVSAMSTGMDPDVLQNQSATAVNIATNSAAERLELVTRNAADAFRQIYKRIFELIKRYSPDQRQIVRGGQVKMVDPSQWPDRLDVKINVGLGTGNKTERLVALTQILGFQEKAMAAGIPLAGPKQLYNALKEYAKAAGLPSADPYFIDPDTFPPQPPEPPQPSEAETIAQAEVAKEQLRLQGKMEEARMKDDRERDKYEGDQMIKFIEMGQRQEAEALRQLQQQPRGEYAV